MRFGSYILILLVFFLSFTSCVSQKSIQTKSNDYKSDAKSLLNEFLGEWKYTDEDMVFVIKLMPKRLEIKDFEHLTQIFDKDDKHVNMVFGYYRIIKNNDTIIDLIKDSRRAHNLNTGTSFNAKLSGGTLTKDDYLKIYFRDSINNKKGITFLKLSKENKEIEWELYRRKHASYEKLSDTDTTYFSVPIRCTLKKVN